MNYQDVEVRGVQTGVAAIGRAIISMVTAASAPEAVEVLVLGMDADWMHVLFPETRHSKRIPWRSLESASVELW